MSDAISQRVRKMTKWEYYVPRERDPNEAHPRMIDLFAQPLYRGEDLRPYQGRPGALDAYKLPSRGMV